MKSILHIEFLNLIEKLGKTNKKKVFGDENCDEIFSKFSVKRDKFSKKEEVLIPPLHLFLEKENPLKGVEIAQVEIISSTGKKVVYSFQSKGEGLQPIKDRLQAEEQRPQTIDYKPKGIKQEEYRRQKTEYRTKI